MPVKVLLTFLFYFNIFVCGISTSETGELSKIYEQNDFCDMKCFEETADRCDQNDCRCDLQNIDFTDVPNYVAQLPTPQVFCKDEDFFTVKWNNTHFRDNIYILEYTDGNEVNYSKPTKCNLYTISQLQRDTLYKVRLYSLNAKAELSGLSEYTDVTTLPEDVIPLPVPELKVKKLIPKEDHYEATLEWTPAEDLSCVYDFVIFDEEEIFEKHIDKPEELFELHLDDLSLQFNSTLLVGIAARHAYSDNESNKTFLEIHIPSCLDTFKTVDRCPPETPEDLTVEEEIVDLNLPGDNPLYNVKVRWTKPKYPPDYYILTVQNVRPDTHQNTTHYEINVTGIATEATVHNIEIGLHYNVRLTAYSKGGASEPADVSKQISGTRAAVLTLANSQSSSSLIFIIVSCVVIILLVVFGFVLFRRLKKMKERVRKRKEYLDELDQVTQTTIDMANLDIEVSEYDDEWEVDQDKLILKTVLGEGAFGVVRRAWFDVGKGEKIEVAIKMLKESPTVDELREFYQEISIMKSVGRHPHIVSLIGCITRGRLKAPLLVVEYCAKGDLQTYLRSIWNAIVNRTSETKTDSQTSSDNFFNKCYEINPTDSLIQPKDLISFAHQVSMGMEYLSSLKVLHRDLAARNVLVCEDRTVKVSDFGLSRDVYCDNVYCKTGAGKLPLKWMAIESLTHQRYTTQSDVWSFGILLWEIVTLGGNPYAGISPNELLNLLQSGYRMEKPKNCSDELYEIMMTCWKASPKERPTFSALRITFDKLLSNMVDYLNLDFVFVNDTFHASKSDTVPPETLSDKYVPPVSVDED